MSERCFQCRVTIDPDNCSAGTELTASGWICASCIKAMDGWRGLFQSDLLLIVAAGRDHPAVRQCLQVLKLDRGTVSP